MRSIAYVFPNLSIIGALKNFAVFSIVTGIFSVIIAFEAINYFGFFDSVINFVKTNIIYAGFA